MDPKDRREHPRFEGEFTVDLLNMGDDPQVPSFEALVPGIALDVSRKGMRLQVSYDVSVGSIISSILYLKSRESICIAEVVWKREHQGKPLYGLFIREWSKIDPLLETRLAAMEREEAKAQQDRTPPSGAPAAAFQIA